MALTQMSHSPAPSLTTIADRHGSDKGSKFGDRHRYTDLYDLILAPLRDEAITLLEIGLASGGPETLSGRLERTVPSPSAGMWLEYFSKAEIVGFDICDFSHLQNKRFTFVRGDAGNADDLTKLRSTSAGFDVIVDDGTGASYHQQFCLKYLWPHLNPGGLYIIEDLHWQSPVYEGLLPAAPLTADLFAAALERGERFDSELFSVRELDALRAEVASFALVRDQHGTVEVPKLLVLRKSATAVQQRLVPRKAEPADAPSPLPRVRSFDLFDTLVSRRCIEPKIVFEKMERQLGLTGFADARVRAEMAVVNGHYTLQDIYDQLAVDHPSLAAKIDELQFVEIGLELQELFPIAENVARVSPGDLIVSDMYLPHQILDIVVREILGLKDVCLFVTTQGKARGEIWSPLQARFEIIEHMGDNEHSDFMSPNAFGIPARITQSWQPTTIEHRIGTLGLKRLSEASREARLSCWSWRRDERELQVLQTNVNGPMLLVASVLVLRAARQGGIEQILASGRDCYLWLKIITRIQEDLVPGITSHYFLTGRVTRTFPSESYKAYVRRLVGGKKTFVLDLCGSGLSMKKLFEKLDLPTAQPLLLHKMKATTVRTRNVASAALEKGVPVYALLDPAIYYDNIPAELANPAPHPTVFDVVSENGIDRAIHPDWPIEPITKRYADVQERAFDAALGPLLSRPVLDELYGTPSETLIKVLAELYGSLPLFSDTVRAQMPEQFAENRMVCEVVLEMEKKAQTKLMQAAE